MGSHPKHLGEIVRELRHARFADSSDPLITSIEYDSRRVRPGSLFVAIPGLKTDGSAFIRDAEANGAAAIVASDSVSTSSTLPIVRVANPRQALAEAAWTFFDHPERHLTCVGITGTNGKTTTASVLRNVLEQTGHRTGMIGTLGIFYGNERADSPRTTPESSDMAAHFAAMRDAGYSHVVMEATSIGIDLERVWGIPFQVAVFTNLTRDHLDYHGTEAAYLAAKIRLFKELSGTATGIVNADDPKASDFLSAISGTRKTYAIEHAADFKAENVVLRRDSVRFDLCHNTELIEFVVPLIGLFNVYNVLAVIAAANALGLPLEETQRALRTVQPVRGRAEVVPIPAPFTVIVDYAHTPDALEKILLTLRSLKPKRITCVFGAGGDRDRGKRPLMANVSEQLSDIVILTSDNPRGEDPEAILQDIAQGLSGKRKTFREVDRRKAIALALQEAQDGDIVLLAGKGHETYQEVSGVKYPFDDRQVVIEEFSKLG